MKGLTFTTPKCLVGYEPNHITILVLHAVSAVLLFLPIMFDVEPAFDYNDRLVPAIDSDKYEICQVVMLTVSMTLLLEALLDHHCDFKIVLCRLNLLLSLLIPSTLTLACSFLSGRRKAQLFICCFEMRNNLVVGALIAAMVEVKSNRQSKLFLLLFSITSIIIFHFWLWEPFVPITASVTAISIFFNILFLSCIVVMAYKSFAVIIRWAKICNQSPITLTVEEMYTVIFSLTLAFNHIVKFINYFIYDTQSWGDIQVNEIVIFCGSDIVFNAVAFILTMRIEREVSYIAKAKLESKKSFVRYISHEIRTPLNIVYMGLQFVKKTQEDQIIANSISNFDSISTPTIPSASASVPNSELTQCVDDMYNACASAINILNDLLLIDKVEDGKLSLEKSKIRIGELFRTSLSPFNAQAKEKQVQFVYDDPSHLPPELEDVLIEVDVNKFTQVIRNLASNAIKFSPDSGRVEVFAKKYAAYSNSWRSNRTIHPDGDENHVLRIEVRDHGPGISQTNQSRLFKEVIQFDAQTLQNGGGSGLGLWISAGIMERHEGTIGVTSSGIAGEGCVFFVEIAVDDWLPRPRHCHSKRPISPGRSFLEVEFSESDDSHASRSLTSTKHTLSRSGSLRNTSHGSSMQYSVLDDVHDDDKKWRALIVDDSKLNVKMARRVLGSLFDELSECYDGSEAIEMVKASMDQSKSFDIIFMDAQMTRVHGPEAALAIRKLGYVGAIVAVSGNVLEEDVVRFKKCGADVYITKPLELSKVEEVLLGFGMPTR